MFGRVVTSEQEKSVAVYPIRVPWTGYGGSNSTKRRKIRRCNEIAQMCEEYINRKVQEGSEQVQLFLYAAMAHDLRLTTEEVADVMIGVEGGHNGIMVRRELIKFSARSS